MLYDKKMREDILSRLEGYRYTHTLGCEKAAMWLGEKYGEDPKKCSLAAVLHDITKRLSREEQLYLCDKYGIIPCDVEKIEWKMLHGRTAAAIARDVYKIPEDVAHAIEYHTTGCEHMTTLDKIVYLADFIEETRDFKGVEPARALAKKDIDKALLYCFDFSLSDLIERGKLIHKDTMQARNWLIKQGVVRS